jgi:hypothetical protein
MTWSGAESSIGVLAGEDEGYGFGAREGGGVV